MKIKTKLIISFCIIIFVPSILAIATISAYCNFQSHVIEQTYGIKNADAYSIINSVPMLNRYTAPDFEKIKKTIKLSPSKMEDVSYLSEINESLEQKYSYLVVRIGENISFNGGSDNEKILSELPVYGANSSKQGVDKYIDRDDEILVKQADFKLDSGEKCTAYIVCYRAGDPPVYFMGDYLCGNHSVTDSDHDDCVDLPEHDYTDPETARCGRKYQRRKSRFCVGYRRRR